MNQYQTTPKADKTDAGNGSKAIGHVGNVHTPTSPDPGHSPNFAARHA
jgi:hypothetical protein